MFDMADPKTYWLNLTNVVLGLVTLVCVVGLVRGVLLDLWGRSRGNAAPAAPSDDHVFFQPELGVTMADGGEKAGERNA